MGLGIIKEWNCLEHGEFDGSHPICPEFGCDSKHVAREFRTAVTIGSRMVKQHDAGMKRSSELYKISNFRSAREGEAAHGGNAGRDLGTEVLWGSDIARKMPGHSLPNLMSAAQKPLVVPRRGGGEPLRLDRNNALADAATEARITARRLPQAEVAVLKGASKDVEVAKSVST